MSSHVHAGYDFSLNDDPQVAVHAVGAEAEPVMVVDGVLRDPASLAAFAAREVSFAPPPVRENFYPGLLGAMPLDFVSALVASLRPRIEAAFGLQDAAPSGATCNFSIVTHAPEQLGLAQRIPHIDTADPLQLAMLHYLCDERFDGTAFYRHRTTGYEAITPERWTPYRAALAADLERHPPPAAYIGADTPLFERTAHFGLKFDRLLIYRSRVLHSGQIDPAVGLSPDPRRGRLTGNVFLTYRRKT
jgi:hypothetical protein